jgi:flavin reductase (DIM6/NTAB) family NADH-FMN oxidoreductase RutF
MTASSFAAVSLDPPLLAVSVNKPGLMHQSLALTDGMYGGRDGCPVITGALGWFVCRKWATNDGGDHTIFVGESIQNGASDRPDLGPLLWHESDYHTLGTATSPARWPPAAKC